MCAFPTFFEAIISHRNSRGSFEFYFVEKMYTNVVRKYVFIVFFFSCRMKKTTVSFHDCFWIFIKFNLHHVTDVMIFHSTKKGIKKRILFGNMTKFRR